MSGQIFRKTRSTPRCVAKGHILLLPLMLLSSPLFAAETSWNATDWWVWPAALFIVSFLIGIVGVLAGIGGGVLFVPIVSGFFPFHIDFVRGTGLMIALGGSLAAAPVLLEKNLASLKLALPATLIASIFSIIGALVGLWISAINPDYIQGGLGALILLVVLFMLRSKTQNYPKVASTDSLSQALQLNGLFFEPTHKEEIHWSAHRTKRGLLCFTAVGFLAGLFGLGAGWANIPVLNLIMGVPIKVAVATSKFSLSIIDTTAVWVYINKGAVLPLLVVPSVVGTMLGAKIGAKLLPQMSPDLIRKLVIFVMFLAGIRSITKSFGI